MSRPSVPIWILPVIPVIFTALGIAGVWFMDVSLGAINTHTMLTNGFFGGDPLLTFHIGVVLALFGVLQAGVIGAITVYLMRDVIGGVVALRHAFGESPGEGDDGGEGVK